MCGFAGLALHDGRIPSRAALQRMAATIRHRGPDEEGFHQGPGVGLAFRRLSIIDLATGSQPLMNEDGSVVIAFNGEIYNYRELRTELLARGHCFRTTSDTEVLVHLYEECGEKLLDRLNGMFAFALWDARRRTLLLARDPIGIKPLLYAETREGFVFGSEMGSILACGDVAESIDPVGLQLHLAWGAVPAPRTILRGVRRLPPGHFATWSEGRLRTSRYWHPLDADPSETPARTFAEGRDRLRALLDDSIQRQIVSDVPLGAFLSGGVDSTAIVGLMKKHVPDVHTFSVGFADDPVFDETRYARAAASFHRTHHVEATLRARDIQELVPSILDGLAEPFGSASLLPTYVVARATRERMTVALSGDGADELFAGYNKYLGEELRRTWMRIPRPVRRALLEPALHALPASRSSRAADLARQARRFVEGAEGDSAIRHERWMRFAGAGEIAELVGLARSGDPDMTNPGLAAVREIQADYDRRGLTDPLNRILFTDLSLALPTDMLLKVDAASMRNSLEVRVPFLDPRIVRLAMGMPGAWKMQHGSRKRVLKAAVHDLLPPEIRRRPKAGFDVPIGEWIKSSMRDLVRDVVFSSEGTPLDRQVLTRWFHEHETARVDRTKAIWAVFTLRWWEAARARDRARTPRESGIQESTAPRAVQIAG